MTVDKYLASCEISIQVYKCLAVAKVYVIAVWILQNWTCLCVNSQKSFLLQPNKLRLCWQNAYDLRCTMDFGDHISCCQISVFLRSSHSNLHVLLPMAKAASLSPCNSSSSVVFLWVVHFDVDWNIVWSRTINSCWKSGRFCFKSW